MARGKFREAHSGWQIPNSRSPDSRFGRESGREPDSRFGQNRETGNRRFRIFGGNRETGNPRFPIRPARGPGFRESGSRWRRAGGFLVWPGYGGVVPCLTRVPGRCNLGACMHTDSEAPAARAVAASHSTLGLGVSGGPGPPGPASEPAKPLRASGKFVRVQLGGTVTRRLLSAGLGERAIVQVISRAAPSR